SHWSTSKTPSYTKSVSWQHHPDDELKVKVQNLISSLFNGDDYDPIGHDPNGEFISQILAELNVWAIKNNQQHSIRIIGV
ncbi:hypothetical protein WKE12_26535, partial [Klebsiella pneumoniae]